MDFAHLVSTSPHYSIMDKYAIHDMDDDILLSGNSKEILATLSPHFKPAIECYLERLEKDDFFDVPRALEGVFGREDE